MSPSAPSGPEKREFATEIKFLVEASTAERVRAWAREHLQRDPNAREDTYAVTSLYYDTANFLVFQKQMPYRHSKYRIRCYDGSTLFLERKLKAGDRVAKHRTLIPAAELAHLAQAANAAWRGHWFQHRTTSRRLRPVCQIDYMRTARVLATPEGPIRLTLDENLRAAPAHEARFQNNPPAQALTDRVVLELKFRRDLPPLFRGLVTQFVLNPQTFSKYRTAVQTLGLAALAAPAPAPVAASASATPSLVPCPSF